VPNVWDAMKKHQAEQAAQAAQAGAPAEGAPAAPADAQTPQTADAPPAGELAGAANNNYAPELMAYHDRGGKITEQYRALRTNLLAQCNDERFCLTVTSAEAGEGKTVTCVNLAMILAERQERGTVIVDGDLRKGAVASLLRLPRSPGLTDLLRGQARLPEVIQPTVYPNLFVIAAGEVGRGEVGEIVGRPEIHEVIAELRRQYDYVLLDTPPVNAFSDGPILGRAAGQAIVVVRMNRTRQESVDRAIRLLRAANVEVAGIVLTHQRYFIPKYLYRYS